MDRIKSRAIRELVSDAGKHGSNAKIEQWLGCNSRHVTQCFHSLN